MTAKNAKDHRTIGKTSIEHTVKFVRSFPTDI